MSWSTDDLGDWTGRTVVVTGGNSGLGLETARAMVARGAQVVLACRSAERGAAAATRLGCSSAVLDLSDLASVASYDVPDRLAALVCNAGIMAPPFLLSGQGHELQMATNHLGHAALVRRLRPALAAAGGRVVVVSSIAARGGALRADTTVGDLVDPQPYDGMAVYRNSKQANLAYALALHDRGVDAVACHPGVSRTDLFARNAPRWRRRVNDAAFRLALQSARAGAQPVLRALDPATPSGSFVGPRRFGQVRGRPELLELYATAADRRVRDHLWELTEQVLATS